MKTSRRILFDFLSLAMAFVPYLCSTFKNKALAAANPLRLTFLLLILFASSCRQDSKSSVKKFTPEEVDAESAKANAFFDRCFDEMVDMDPELQTYLGIKQDYGQWTDRSDSFQVKRNELARRQLEELKKTVEFDKLDDQARLSYRLFEHDAQELFDAFPWRYHNYPVNQMDGVQSGIPAFLINMHRIDAVGDAEAYVQRLKGIGPLMIGIVTAQELRMNLGEGMVLGRTYSEWIDAWIQEIARDFLKPDEKALMEVVAPDGSLIDHTDGRTLNPGHALECSWFIMHEGRLRGNEAYVKLGLQILDWMWERGWDQDFGGLFYFRDLKGLPVQEYWHDMKFWWPHNEAIIATLLAWKLTGDVKYAAKHQQVHDWSFAHFPDREHGEWFGYLHRDGRISQRAKGNMFKGPFHLPRMLWVCARELSGDHSPKASLS